MALPHILVLLAARLTTCIASPLNIYWLDPAKSDARCMDGSRFGYYFRPATDEIHARKWVIELQGGGWCFDEGDCYGRTLSSYSNGVLGSSENWTSTMGGYFLESQDWNRVFLRYCSGESFTGYRAEGWDASGWRVPGHPGLVVPNGTKLWFRGAANVADTILALQQDHGMAAVEELIVAGSSAGGLSTILNVDRIGSLVGARRVVGLADAGFFKYEANHTPPHYSGSANYSENMRRLFGMVNASGVLSAACQAAQAPGAATAVPTPGGAERPTPGPWNCMTAATAVEYVESPLFILQSAFDHFQLGSMLALDCMTSMPYNPPWNNATCRDDEVTAIAGYGADLSAELARVIAAPSERRAVFLSACIVHGQLGRDSWTGTAISGITPQQAWRAWYGGESAANSTWVEESRLPDNPNSLSCAPYASEVALNGDNYNLGDAVI